MLPLGGTAPQNPPDPPRSPQNPPDPRAWRFRRQQGITGINRAPPQIHPNPPKRGIKGIKGVGAGRPLLAHVGAASGGRGGMWGADGGGSPLRKSQEGQPPRIMLPSCAGGRVLPALPRLLDQSPQVLRILFEIRPGFGLGPVRVSANIFELESGPGAEILWAH